MTYWIILVSRAREPPCLHLLPASPQGSATMWFSLGAGAAAAFSSLLQYFSLCRENNWENLPLLRKELIKPIGGTEVLQTHSCAKDGMMEGEKSLILAQQCDTIRIHWEWTWRLSLGLWSAQILPAVEICLFSFITSVATLPGNAFACHLSTLVLPHAGPVERSWTAPAKIKTLKKLLFSFSFSWVLLFHTFSTWALIKPKISLLLPSCHCHALQSNSRM